MCSRKYLFAKIVNTLLVTVKNKYNSQNLNQLKSHSTFHKWILDYFKNQPKYKKFMLKQSMNEINKPVNSVELKNISTDELLLLFSTKSVKSYSEINDEIINRVNDMSINQILFLMDTCLTKKDSIIKNSTSCFKCIEIMDELWFRKPDLTPLQTIQLIYYISTYKDKSKPIVEFGLKKLIDEINYIKHLSNEELSILAVATYKSNAKVSDKILRVFAYRVEKNVDELLQNPLHFVSLIKPLKKAKYHEPVLLNQLITSFSNNYSSNNKVLNDVISSIHFLTYLADANCGDVKLLQQLIDSIGNIMIKDNLLNYRIKDVSNYVFSTSYLGLVPTNSSVCKIIINFLEQVFNTKEKCKKHSKALIGICLSMWMLDSKPIKLIKFIFSEVSFAALRMPNIHKQNNRLNLLLRCIIIEEPDLLMYKQLDEESSKFMPDVYKHLGERPFLVLVFQTLQKLSHTMNISNVEYIFNIPHLKILGIQFLKNNSEVIYVEVLDNCNCLYNTEIPNGMMKLKYRLESKLNLYVITVNYKEKSLHNSVTLKQYLASLLS